MRVIGLAQAAQIECRCVGEKMCDEGVCCCGCDLCVTEVDQHRGVIDVIRRSEITHAIGPKHEWEIGVERAGSVVDGE
jgi:hypothetical protein